MEKYNTIEVQKKSKHEFHVTNIPGLINYLAFPNEFHPRLFTSFLVWSYKVTFKVIQSMKEVDWLLPIISLGYIVWWT